ncbi:hypothetical protein DN523_23070 [Burkholderia multivorans]|uniref:Uncharacterized protein n=1 Tax=Burkholderia multivorans TaxID=87883 RepID=A0A2S9LV45_9BURK|nr:hypothetical protein A8H40_26795 [Burkholderia multivorans]PRD79278.1 hypothetical protein C6P74_13685 [Burkholderia multivorans]PRD84046.1 hypothetical protein C6P76_21360 [Burkholderia multivorans]PRE11046.1 hypothetical protein C6P92_22290 [Burkholderia multivorans]PRE31257.1 hypothetical protein C6P79_03740 [Burkholderia multivorans]
MLIETPSKTFFSRANVKKYQITRRISRKVKESVACHCANARAGALFACGTLWGQIGHQPPIL